MAPLHIESPFYADGYNEKIQTAFQFKQLMITRKNMKKKNKRQWPTYIHFLQVGLECGLSLSNERQASRFDDLVGLRFCTDVSLYQVMLEK